MTELSGYDAEFVEPPKELQADCSICLSILRDPFIVNCCGMSFCYLCIKPIVDLRKPQCPLCKGNPKPLAEDKRLSRQLSQRKVFCSNKKLDCEWIGLLADYDKHLNSASNPPENRLEGCSFVKIKCLYCDEHFTRGELVDHEDNCPQKIYNCEFCNSFTDTKYVLSNQHYGVCDRYPVDCSNECGKRFPRFKLKPHLSDDCPITTVNCDYQYAGCEAWLMRRDLEDHMTRNAKKHASLLNDENIALIGDIQKLEEKLESVVFDCVTAMEDKSRLTKENDELRKHKLEDDMELTEMFTELKYRETEISNTTKYLEDLKKANAECKEKASKLKTQTSLSKQLGEDIVELERILDEAVLEQTKKQSLLEEFELEKIALKDRLAEYQQKCEEMTKEMDSLKEQHETEIASRDMELDKDRRMVTKLEKKLKNESKLDLPVSDVYTRAHVVCGCVCNIAWVHVFVHLVQCACDVSILVCQILEHCHKPSLSDVNTVSKCFQLHHTIHYARSCALLLVPNSVCDCAGQ